MSCQSAGLPNTLFISLSSTGKVVSVTQTEAAVSVYQQSQNCWESKCQYLSTPSSMANFDWSFCSGANMSFNCAGSGSSSGGNATGAGSGAGSSNSTSPTGKGNSTSGGQSSASGNQSTGEAGPSSNSSASQSNQNGAGSSSQSSSSNQQGSGSNGAGNQGEAGPTVTPSTLIVTETGLPVGSDAVFGVSAGGSSQSISTDLGDTLYLDNQYGSAVDAQPVNYHGLSYYPTVVNNDDGTVSVNYAPSAQVLIVTNSAGFGTSAGEQTAISDYQAQLTSQGLTSAVVDISSPDYTALTGLPPVTRGTSLDYVQAVQNLESAATDTKYVAILGGDSSIPMTQGSYSNQPVNPTQAGFNPSGNPSTEYNYQGYATGPSGQTVYVGVIPGQTPDQVGQMIEQGLSYTPTSVQSTNPMIVGASDDKAQYNINQISSSMTSSGTGSSTVILSSTPNLESNLASAANNPNNNVQIIVGDSNGYSVGSPQTTSTTPDLYSSTSSVPSVSDSNPVVIASSCFGAAQPAYGSSTPTLATTYLNNGASAFIGWTSEVQTNGGTGEAILNGVTSPGFAPSSQMISYLQGQLATGIPNAVAVQNTINHFSGSFSASTNANAGSLVYYGLPTQKTYTGSGSG